MTVHAVIAITVLAVEYLVKIIAIGFVPAGRRPSSGQAWLLAVLFLPIIGSVLFLLIGSPYVHGRRHRIQQAANRAIAEYASTHQDSTSAEIEAVEFPAARTLITLNRRLTALPAVAGRCIGLHPDSDEWVRAVTRAVTDAERFVHLEIYILALDPTTRPLFDALAAAVRRGVTVRVLYDHIGSRGYPGHKEMNRFLDRAGIEWHRMMPVDPLHGQWRRPDLRNHRKLVVIDGTTAFMGSQNMIDASYLSPKNIRIGRRWVDLNVELAGPIVSELDVVFTTDWYAETDERLDLASPPARSAGDQVFQLVPSGPGFPTEPNLRQFVAMIHAAETSVSIVSPYFVPDEALLTAITSAAHRGVTVELFVSEQADQFMVDHAQRSYYRQLLESGVRIWRYPKPAVLHTKLVTVDGTVAAVGSSNMDMRSFALDYEIMLLGFDREFVGRLDAVIADYRARSVELPPSEWAKRPWREKYVDNALRLTAALQ